MSVHVGPSNQSVASNAAAVPPEAKQKIDMQNINFAKELIDRKERERARAEAKDRFERLCVEKKSEIGHAVADAIYHRVIRETVKNVKNGSLALSKSNPYCLRLPTLMSKQENSDKIYKEITKRLNRIESGVKIADWHLVRERVDDLADEVIEFLKTQFEQLRNSQGNNIFQYEICWFKKKKADDDRFFALRGWSHADEVNLSGYLCVGWKGLVVKTWLDPSPQSALNKIDIPWKGEDVRYSIIKLVPPPEKKKGAKKEKRVCA